MQRARAIRERLAWDEPVPSSPPGSLH